MSTIIQYYNLQRLVCCVLLATMQMNKRCLITYNHLIFKPHLSVAT